MKILFIEDDEASVYPARELLKADNHDCEIIDFDNIADKISIFLPDIIVLDMMKGEATLDPKGEGGKSSFDKIWDNRFCPLIVYSADPDLIDDIDPGKSSHPLVKKVTKGRDSEEVLQTKINEFKPCIDGMNGIIDNVNKVLHRTLRDVAPYIFARGGVREVDTLILHMGKRRIAALMDDDTMFRSKLDPLEQYICPPLADYPKMGDIIRGTKADPELPESFRIILTPSCDLVKGGGRVQKVEKVLCARCESSDVLFSKAQVKKDRERLARELSQGYIKEYLPIPEIPGMIPAMVANLKDMELIPYLSIGSGEASGLEFVRVASIDSPFREQIAWAYLNTGCRPGVPDRDCDCWADQYLNDGSTRGKKKP